jgi:hypothetical protein
MRKIDRDWRGIKPPTITHAELPIGARTMDQTAGRRAHRLGKKIRKMKHFTDDHECYMSWNVQYFGFFEVKIAVRKTSQFLLQLI